MRFHVRGRVGAIPLGPLRLGAALVYLGGLALAPVLPPRLLAWFAIASLALIGAAWVRGGRCTKASEAVWLWPPIQLAIHATSGLASPLLPLLVGWIITLGAVGTWIWASAGGIVGTILLLATAAWVESIVPARAAEAVVLAAIGCAAAWLIEVTRWRATVERRTLARILSEAEAGSDAPPEAAAAGRLEQLEWSLAGVRRRLGADRVVLWQLDEDDDLARAMLASGGGTPDSVALSSSPFDWVWREGLTVRLDAPPTWAPGAAAVWLARVEGREGRRQILSAEFGAQGAETTQASMAEEAEFLSAVLRIHGREARAVAAREHMERVLGFLGRIPAELEIGPLARTLATSAMEVTGATGAAVVRWDGIAGRVLVVAGEDGGPAVGATFGEMESEVALAIRNDAPIVREDRRPVPGALPAVSPSERWHAQPTALAAYPLRDDREILGAVIVW
ncbi:MAG TPA: hypothetical protein VNZ57_15180, partial [Longimicrobiales bacterium]|nr:hypothetical protein [Longimicrobiales bacterium]